jgi:hypothetical protein
LGEALGLHSCGEGLEAEHLIKGGGGCEVATALRASQAGIVLRGVQWVRFFFAGEETF